MTKGEPRWYKNWKLMLTLVPATLVAITGIHAALVSMGLFVPEPYWDKINQHYMPKLFTAEKQVTLVEHYPGNLTNVYFFPTLNMVYTERRIDTPTGVFEIGIWVPPQSMEETIKIIDNKKAWMEIVPSSWAGDDSQMNVIVCSGINSKTVIKSQEADETQPGGDWTRYKREYSNGCKVTIDLNTKTGEFKQVGDCVCKTQ